MTCTQPHCKIQMYVLGMNKCKEVIVDTYSLYLFICLFFSFVLTDRFYQRQNKLNTMKSRFFTRSYFFFKIILELYSARNERLT